MNKQNLILWGAAALLTFLAGFLKSVTGPGFPVSGTVGIEGNRVTYHFERRAHVKDSLEVLIRPDLQDLQGRVLVFGRSGDTAAYPMSYNPKREFLAAKIPAGHLPGELRYSVELRRGANVIRVPAGNEFITTKCYPKVPVSLTSTAFILLYLGLLLALRIGLEAFAGGRKVKKWTLFTATCFSLYALFIVPVIHLFELNAVNRMAPDPLQMFSPVAFLPAVVWILGTVVLFRAKDHRIPAALLAVATLVAFAVV